MRLIDAEELFNKVGKIVPRNTTHYKAIGEFMNMITNSSTIEPKQGEWITERIWFTFQGKIFRIDQFEVACRTSEHTVALAEVVAGNESNLGVLRNLEVAVGIGDVLNLVQ